MSNVTVLSLKRPPFICMATAVIVLNNKMENLKNCQIFVPKYRASQNERKLSEVRNASQSTLERCMHSRRKHISVAPPSYYLQQRYNTKEFLFLQGLKNLYKAKDQSFFFNRKYELWKNWPLRLLPGRFSGPQSWNQRAIFLLKGEGWLWRLSQFLASHCTGLPRLGLAWAKANFYLH